MMIGQQCNNLLCLLRSACAESSEKKIEKSKRAPLKYDHYI